MSEDISDELLEDLYAWVDHIPLSRPMKDIRRDFADGVMVAEVMKYYFPRLVELHNYSSAFNVQNRTTNWNLLNRKVFQKLHFEVRDDVIDNIVRCKPWAIEHFLMLLRRKIDRQLYEKKRTLLQQDQEIPTQQPRRYSDRPEVDQWTEATSPVFDKPLQGRTSKQGLTNQSGSPGKSQSQQNLNKVITESKRPSGGSVGYQGQLRGQGQGRVPDKVPRVEVEELEQEILGRDETIQILEAKIRRLEQLLHLKDIRLDDLQTRLDRIEVEKRPTAQVPAHGHPNTVRGNRASLRR